MKKILFKITDWVSEWEATLCVSGWYGTKTYKLFSKVKKFLITKTYGANNDN